MREKKSLFFDILAIAGLVLLTFWINRDIRIAGLYMDDLNLWSYYAEETLQEFAFSRGYTRCRNLYYLFYYIEAALIGIHIERVVIVNLVILVLNAAVFYFFAEHLSGNKAFAFLGACILAVSRFSYYAVGQMLGPLESLAMLFSLLEAGFLYQYMEGGRKKYYVLALLMYTCSVFIHERYMVLIPMFFYALLAIRFSGFGNDPQKKETWIIGYVITLLDFIAIQAVRLFFIGTLLPAGTGHSDVVGDFSISQTISHVKEELYYLAGFNKGPEYLCGIEWQNVPEGTKMLVAVSLVSMLLIAVMFMITFFSGRTKASEKGLMARDALYFAGFIIGLVVASSVTIRVEMRWLHASSAFLYLLVFYAFGAIRRYNGSHGMLLPGLMLVMLVSTLLYNIQMRSGWKNIYFFPEQKSYNSLADETWGKYGEDIFDKKIYIIGNPFGVTDFYASYFFRVYDRTLTGRTPEVIFVDSLEEIPARDASVIILEPDVENHCYITK